MTSDIQAVGINPAAPAVPAQTTVAAGHGFSFHDLLSAMNPLQYLPVVGTIYRAVTGDVIPEMLRNAGSMLVSGLLGGPIGLIINIATTIAEKATGIDPEKIITAQLNPPAPVAAKPADDGPMAPPADVSAHLPTGATAAQLPLSQSQLEAYGVSTNTSGNLMLGTIEGADVLNAIQLAGLSRTAAAAYGANQLPPPRAAARGG